MIEDFDALFDELLRPAAKGGIFPARDNPDTSSSIGRKVNCSHRVAIVRGYLLLL
jgi:hypothetical protein